jgi:hypothetical protein
MGNCKLDYYDKEGDDWYSFNENRCCWQKYCDVNFSDLPFSVKQQIETDRQKAMVIMEAMKDRK